MFYFPVFIEFESIITSNAFRFDSFHSQIDPFLFHSMYSTWLSISMKLNVFIVKMYHVNLPFKMLKVAGDEDILFKFTIHPNYEQ